MTWDDATAQAERVAKGEVSPVELVDEAIARIEKLNPRLNAVIVETFDKARAAAKTELPKGPFRGVPLLLKDLHCPAEGDPQYAGTRFLRDAGWKEDHDGNVTKRFRRAGFVVLGRTNTPEFGLTITTEPVSAGPTRNPWNPDHSAGGSSGGSAAAVASGMVAAAHASDGGGSIRIPASECGLIGLKPSRARISKAPGAGEGWAGSATDGALTRSVRDAAALVDVLAGAEPGDPYAAIPLRRPLVEEVGADPGKLRVGLLDHPLQLGVARDEEMAAAVAKAGKLLAGLGHYVEVGHPKALEDPEFPQRFLTVVTANAAAEVDTWEKRLGHSVQDKLEPTTALFVGLGHAETGVSYVRTLQWLHEWTRRVVEWWAGCSGAAGDAGWDVLVSPVLNGVPPRLGWLTDPDQGGARVAEMLQYTAQFNVTGQPALSLPLAASSAGPSGRQRGAGLPIGIQLVAAPGREDILVRLASQIEAAEPWQPWGSATGGRPAISADSKRVE